MPRQINNSDFQLNFQQVLLPFLNSFSKYKKTVYLQRMCECLSMQHENEAGKGAVT